MSCKSSETETGYIVNNILLCSQHSSPSSVLVRTTADISFKYIATSCEYWQWTCTHKQAKQKQRKGQHMEIKWLHWTTVVPSWFFAPVSSLDRRIFSKGFRCCPALYIFLLIALQLWCLIIALGEIEKLMLLSPASFQIFFLVDTGIPICV